MTARRRFNVVQGATYAFCFLFSHVVLYKAGGSATSQVADEMDIIRSLRMSCALSNVIDE